jgi:iron complex outermembrane receptor protein
LNYKRNKWDFIFGGALNKYWGNHFGKVIWTQVAEKGNYHHEWYRSQGIKTDFNVYGKAGWKLTSGLNLFGDLQLRKIWYNIDGIDDDLRELTQEHNYLFFNPKFGVNYNFLHGHKTYFSISVANREPNRSNLVDANPAGPVPTYETLIDYELGYGFNSGKFALKSNIYFMDYKNQLVLTGEINDVGAPVMTNVDKSYRLGLEVVTGYRILKNLAWEFNITLSRNKILDYTGYVDDWDNWSQRPEYLGNTDLSFSPSVVAGNSISWEAVKNLNISVISKYVGKQFIDNTSHDSRALNSYLVHDFSVQYNIYTRIIPEIGFNFLLNNFSNTSYETNAWVYRYYYQDVEQYMDGYFPQAGIHFLFGMKIKF